MAQHLLEGLAVLFVDLEEGGEVAAHVVPGVVLAFDAVEVAGFDPFHQGQFRVNFRLGYGGDFGERQSDYAFSGNGIVFADGTEKPAMQEVRYWYASPEERMAHDEANRRAMEAAVLPAPERKCSLAVIRGDGALGVRGKDFEILFSYPEGGPVSLVSKGQEWLWRAPRPAYWRAPTENDLGCGFAWNSSIWAAADAAIRTFSNNSSIMGHVGLVNVMVMTTSPEFIAIS